MDAVNETEVEVADERGGTEVVTVVEEGIDLDDYYPSVEWDIMWAGDADGKDEKERSSGQPRRQSARSSSWDPKTVSTRKWM